MALAPMCHSLQKILRITKKLTTLPSICNFQVQNGKTSMLSSVNSQQIMHIYREKNPNHKLIMHQRRSHLGYLLPGKIFYCKFSPPKPGNLSGDKQIAISRIPSSWDLNACKDGDSACSLGSLYPCHPHHKKSISWWSRGTLLCFSFVPMVLPLGTTEKCLSSLHPPFFIPSLLFRLNISNSNSFVWKLINFKLQS